MASPEHRVRKEESVPKSIVMESECGTLPLEASRLLSTYGLYYSVLFSCYGAVFCASIQSSREVSRDVR